MKWNLRVQAAERGMWTSAEPRRILSDAGLEISVGQMSVLGTGTPTTTRPYDRSPTDLLVPEPEKVQARKPGARRSEEANGSTNLIAPRFGPKHDRPAPPL